MLDQGKNISKNTLSDLVIEAKQFIRKKLQKKLECVEE